MKTRTVVRPMVLVGIVAYILYVLLDHPVNDSRFLGGISEENDAVAMPMPRGRVGSIDITLNFTSNRGDLFNARFQNLLFRHGDHSVQISREAIELYFLDGPGERGEIEIRISMESDTGKALGALPHGKGEWLVTPQLAGGETIPCTATVHFFYYSYFDIYRRRKGG